MSVRFWFSFFEIWRLNLDNAGLGLLAKAMAIHFKFLFAAYFELYHLKELNQRDGTIHVCLSTFNMNYTGK
jgi:hypothetical protein